MYLPRTYSFTHTHTSVTYYTTTSGRAKAFLILQRCFHSLAQEWYWNIQPRVTHHPPGVFPFGIRRQQFQLHVLLTMSCGDRSAAAATVTSGSCRMAIIYDSNFHECICPPTSVEPTGSRIQG